MKPHLIYDQRNNKIAVEDIPSHHEAEEILAGMLLDPDYANHELVIISQEDSIGKDLIAKEQPEDKHTALDKDYLHFGHYK
jgi:hypothetical protein